MSYDSKKHKTEHYGEGEFDAFGPDGKRAHDIKVVTLRRRAVREREERHARRERKES